MNDDIVRPEVTASYVRRLCVNGNKVTFLTIPKVGHGFIARDTADQAVDWMADRFAGRHPQSDCVSREPVAETLQHDGVEQP